MSVSIGWKSRESLARSEFRFCVAWLGIGFWSVFCVDSRFSKFAPLSMQFGRIFIESR
ncbi:MAG: hypothetical protein SPJ16_08835 [Helicobacter sp.]|uniref:hypothetical protein n=1 Tax=Helicobacter sp. TaxID=218 RepID=UPI002A91498A|nr:hypothetical protein [Helicobacter sp.]MDY5951280.1 hypothetical protein [Helicobacter sp.]